jgi:SnoaL-like protein
VLGSSLVSFAQQKDTTTDPQTTQKIRAISRAYDETVNNNNAAALAAVFTEHAVFVSDRGPIHGRQAIENWYAGMFQILHPRNHIGTPDGTVPTLIVPVAMRHGKPENGARLNKVSQATPSNPKAIGQRFIFARAMIGKSGC